MIFGGAPALEGGYSHLQHQEGPTDPSGTNNEIARWKFRVAEVGQASPIAGVGKDRRASCGGVASDRHGRHLDSAGNSV
jgi:hypothetical protein